MLNDVDGLLMEIAERDPMQTEFTPHEWRAYEAGFDRGLEADVRKSYLMALLDKVDGPLVCCEIVGMMTGGRARVMGCAPEVSA